MIPKGRKDTKSAAVRFIRKRRRKASAYGAVKRLRMDYIAMNVQSKKKEGGCSGHRMKRIKDMTGD